MRNGRRPWFHAWQPSALTALDDSIARGETYQADAKNIEITPALRTPMISEKKNAG